MIVHKKISSLGVADLIQPLGSERLFDGRLHALADHLVIGVGVALHGLIAGNHVPRNDRPGVALACFVRFRRGAPRPGGQFGYANAGIASDLDVVVAASEQESAK